jgi:hypothetical protein
MSVSSGFGEGFNSAFSQEGSSPLSAAIFVFLLNDIDFAEIVTSDLGYERVSPSDLRAGELQG